MRMCNDYTISANNHIGFDDIAAVKLKFGMVALFPYRLERLPEKNVHAELDRTSVKDKQ